LSEWMSPMFCIVLSSSSCLGMIAFPLLKIPKVLVFSLFSFLFLLRFFLCILAYCFFFSRYLGFTLCSALYFFFLSCYSSVRALVGSIISGASLRVSCVSSGRCP
jgi:hypothetical protein